MVLLEVTAKNSQGIQFLRLYINKLGEKKRMIMKSYIWSKQYNIIIKVIEILNTFRIYIEMGLYYA